MVPSRKMDNTGGGGATAADRACLRALKVIAANVDAAGMSVRELKAFLNARGVDHSKCIEKSEMRALVEAHAATPAIAEAEKYMAMVAEHLAMEAKVLGQLAPSLPMIGPTDSHLLSLPPGLQEKCATWLDCFGLAALEPTCTFLRALTEAAVKEQALQLRVALPRPRVLLDTEGEPIATESWPSVARYVQAVAAIDAHLVHHALTELGTVGASWNPYNNYMQGLDHPQIIFAAPGGGRLPPPPPPIHPASATTANGLANILQYPFMTAAFEKWRDGALKDSGGSVLEGLSRHLQANKMRVSEGNAVAGHELEGGGGGGGNANMYLITRFCEGDLTDAEKGLKADKKFPSIRSFDGEDGTVFGNVDAAAKLYCGDARWRAHCHRFDSPSLGRSLPLGSTAQEALAYWLNHGVVMFGAGDHMSECVLEQCAMRIEPDGDHISVDGRIMYKLHSQQHPNF